MTWLIVIGAIVVIIALFLWVTYNALVKLNVRVEEAWSDITVQLKRRLDLIPNLVSAVKGYAKHEKEVLENVTKTRAEALNAQGVKETAEAENHLQEALKSLFAVSENYPQLRATENFQKLQDELVDAEDKIQASRRFYNGGVRDLNTKIQMFPTNIFANMLGFKEREFFETEDRETAEKPVDVKF